ncbi:MAG: hypothetical protein COX79_02675 [Candidatus Levybacteria bacterium CG_4_10_14_0_2_um_filter_36_16]|nr:MAG: hypothetical protein AUK12_04990 [Candidatus Levybacteria bacterium CG2_30_37_29]PIZ97300.1 MAG: hypothetical protein COX79_02675 [Candidatus Levybacteria bacterium CG_4_10_14_0_2_um_filter_36_16]PJA90900.1 MAG: hypothetical protein CO136_00230 [Candidatus Levybacteria bacterium CG_4_9_14_3_um_filter_36_7]
MINKEYYRKITEVFPRLLSSVKTPLLELLCLFLFLLVLFFVWEINYLWNIYQSVKSQRAYVVQKEKYWEGVITQHPNFPDAYYQAASYVLKLSDSKKAEKFLNKALMLDPNFKEAIELKKSLN